MVCKLGVCSMVRKHSWQRLHREVRPVVGWLVSVLVGVDDHGILLPSHTVRSSPARFFHVEPDVSLQPFFVCAIGCRSPNRALFLGELNQGVGRLGASGARAQKSGAKTDWRGFPRVPGGSQRTLV